MLGRWSLLDVLSDEEENGKITNLELVHWVNESDSLRGQALSDGHRPEKIYQTFDDLYASILEHGPLVVASSKVDAIFFTPSGMFDGHLIALRMSGRNVRRFLIRSDHFDDLFGTVSSCINHVLSNNVPECAVELKHLHDLADELGLSADAVDPSRDVNRMEVDIIAALQLLKVLEAAIEDDEARRAIFEIGFSVGRLFSSVQNYATLAPDAVKAREYERSYAERGKKGKSKDRKQERLEHLFKHLVDLCTSNAALSRLKPLDVAKLALQDASKENPKLWSQGGGQLEQYLTIFASDPHYRATYYSIFGKTG